MVHVAKEMERQKFDLPLLIGGATTSKVHTAVKIAPHYSHPVIHVNDASRSVPVVSSLLSKDQKQDLLDRTNVEYDRLRKQHAGAQAANKFITMEEARKNAWPSDWLKAESNTPLKPGVTVLKDYSIAELAEYIDWTPFFHSWEMKGSYPKIFSDPERGVEAKKLFNDAQQMLKQVIDEKWIQANGVIGLFPANADGDDIIVFSNEERKTKRAVFHTLRQQTKKPAGQYNMALSDFVAPLSSNVKDYIGTFAVACGEGIDKHVAAFEANHDDYSAIMLKAIADRLAEAFAERLHQRVRKEFWGYAADEHFANDELIKEEYDGIRPAPGYPAQPDHTEKNAIWDLLDVEKNAGITLTESLAMLPTAAVSGLYFSHPTSQYFGIGKIQRDQVEEYAQRKGMSIDETERWLSPALGYEPVVV